MLRSGNKAAALLTLLGDAAKGWLAMWLAGRLGADAAGVAMAGIAAFLGHVFPLFLGFKGGKGVATALGVLLGFSGALAGATAVVWLGVVIFTRYSSLAALAAAAAAPALTWWLLGRADVIAAVSFMCAVLVYRHRNNIRNLLAGTEGRVGGRKPKRGSPPV